jgi:hypothetical protein
MTATLEQALNSFFKGNTNIVAKISTRSYPIKWPQGVTMPCLTFKRGNTPKESTHDSSGLGDYSSPKLYITIWSTTFETGKEIADVVRAELNGKLTIGTLPYSITATFQCIDEIPDFNPDFEVYTVVLIFLVQLTE